MSPNRVPGVAMVLWLAVQIGALALSACRVPLALGMPSASEQSALAVMLIIQVAAAAFFSPLLLTSRRQTLIAIIVAWPMAQLASFLADVPPQRVAFGEAYVSIWILTLALWIWALPRPVSEAIFPAVAALLALGGPMLWYLRAEFVTQSDILIWSRDAMLGPVMGALSQIVPPRAAGSAWWLASILITPAIVLGLIRRSDLLQKHPTNPAQ
jgi:hypothetical protein